MAKAKRATCVRCEHCIGKGMTTGSFLIELIGTQSNMTKTIARFNNDKKTLVALEKLLTEKLTECAGVKVKVLVSMLDATSKITRSRLTAEQIQLL